MRILTFVLALLVGASSFAQAAQGGGGQGSGNVKRGHFLKPEQYATQGTLALFVDGASGNDSNACTASGSSACLTIQGAINKIPELLQYAVTVDIAAGTYAGFRMINHAVNPASTASPTGSIYVRGAAQSNFSPATGSATGTVTSVSTDAVGFHVVTDSGQTWTVDNLSTRFLSLTGGTGSGQVCPIISNTATAVTVSCTFSPAPVAGTTYAIVTPSVLITSSVNNTATATGAAGGAAGIILSNLSYPRVSLAGYVLQDLEVSGSFTSVTMVDARAVGLTRIRAAPTNSVSYNVEGATQVQILNSVGSSGTASAVAVGQNTQSDLMTVNAASNFFTSAASGTGGATILCPTRGSAARFLINETVNTSSTGAAFALLGGTVKTVNLSGRFRCTTASTNTGIRVLDGSASGFLGPNQAQIIATTSMDTCGTGLDVRGAAQVANLAVTGGTITFLSNTLAVNARGGGKVVFTTAVPTFTSNTTDISVDGATSTRAAFVALTPNSIVDLSYLSAVYLQP